MDMQPPGAILRVVPPAKLDAAMAQQDQERAQAIAPRPPALYDSLSGLAAHIRSRFDMMKRHRNSASGWSERLLQALRVFNGQYTPEKLQEIKKFGGSTVYARVIAQKCRGASSLLRDVYLGEDRPWGIEAPDDPEIPDEQLQAIEDLIQAELGKLQELGGPMPDEATVRDRAANLIEAARQAAKKKAGNQADIAEDKIDQVLKEGGFYKALAEFLVDLPLFPFAVIKGPVVRIVPTVMWNGNVPYVDNRPRLFWYRLSPFDVWWTPGVADIDDAEIIEHTRLTRSDLNDLLDLPGYNSDNIRKVLTEYANGYTETPDSTDAERAVQENRENPVMNESGLISCLEYTGNVQGLMLLQYGMDPRYIPDPVRDYFVQVWMIGRYIIKVQLSPSPRKRHPYFITSFEKVPGTPVGNGLPDILNDIQDVCNATLRALVNNLSISSGPQVVVNDDLLAADEDGEELYPWKRWHVRSDPMGNSSSANKPVDFFQPTANAQELLGVYQKFVDIADELSAIPKYLSGAGAGSGAGRTASGLAMLMGNASKILQTVAANIDRDVMGPALTSLFDMILLTDMSGLLTGEEKIRVKGVAVAVQKETQRARQMEFLAATANPIDMQIVGPKGRATVLRAVAQTLGLPGADIVPSDDVLAQQQRTAAAVADAQGVPGHGGMGDNAAAAQGDQNNGNTTEDMGPRTRIAGGVG